MLSGLAKYIYSNTQGLTFFVGKGLMLVNSSFSIKTISPFSTSLINFAPIWDADKIINAYFEAPKKGFNTQLMGKDLLYWSSTLLNLSKRGLENRGILNKHGKDETVFLNHLQKVIDNKTTNADHMISKFSNNEDLSELYDK